MAGGKKRARPRGKRSVANKRGTFENEAKRSRQGEGPGEG